MKKIRLYYDFTNGWILDVDFALKPIEVERVIDFTLSKQKDRIISMDPGPRRDVAEKALNILKIGRGKVVSQNFVGTTNEKELYLNDKRKL